MFRSILIATMLLLLFSVAEPLFGQEQSLIVDTTGYAPMPEGLDYNLSLAASQGYAFEIHRLIKLGANPDYSDIIGATPIIYAIANNRYNAVIALLAYEPKLNFLTFEGESPLHIAAKYNLIEIGEALIRKGADINFRDRYGCTPLHYTAIYNYLYFTDMLLYYEASTDTRSLDGTTPLMAAVWVGDAETTDLLIQAGANTGIADNQGFTPLLVAAQNGDTLVARLLLTNGADISSINKYNYNALGIAIRSDQIDMTNYLLERMNISNGEYKNAINPVEIARSYSRKEILDILNNQGIKNRKGIGFDHVSFTANSKFNFHDLYLGGRISFADPYYKFRIITGFDFKPAYSKVLLKESDNNFYQYMDKRYLFYAGAGKEFTFYEDYLKGEFSLEAVLNLGYMVAEPYRGTYIRADNSFVLMPSLLVNWNRNPFNFHIGYEYMNTGLYKAGPGWIIAGISVNLFFERTRAPLKDIKWY